MKLADYLAHVATVYLSHKHEPYSIVVREAYDKLKLELVAQYRMMQNGLAIEHTDSDPYPNSSSMFEDISNNRRLRVYKHAVLPHRHPMSAVYAINRQYLTFNDIFRAVHDGLAPHYPGRHGFGPIGEYRAYLAYCTYLSPMARWAIFTETVAQFACYYYGPNPKQYAPQYATLLPLELTQVRIEDI